MTAGLRAVYDRVKIRRNQFCPWPSLVRDRGRGVDTHVESLQMSLNSKGELDSGMRLMSLFSTCPYPAPQTRASGGDGL